MKSPAVHCAYDKLVALDKLKPNPDNPNQHDGRSVEVLARLLTEHGWRAPITVSNRSGLIVRGHGRLMAARKLGLARVPVDFQDYASAALELADLVADNVGAQFSGMDKALVAKLLSEISIELPDVEAVTAVDEAWLTEFIGELDPDAPVLEEKEIKLQAPLKRMHVLLSFPIALAPDVLPRLKDIRDLKGVECETGQN